MIVYIYTFPNGKKYIGQTTKTLAKRAQKGEGYRGQFVYRAIKKYGWENIDIEIFKCKTENEMDKLERQLIIKYKAMDRKFGYNRESGGNLKKYASQKTKEKMSNAHKGYKNPNYGKSMSKKQKQKISEAHKKPVICLNTGEIYECADEAAKEIGLKSGERIRQACRAFGDFIEIKGLCWGYLEDFENLR